MKSDRIQITKRVKRIVIKAGSALLTGPNGPLFFKKLARELAALHLSGKKTVLVSSGAVATGMDLLALKKRPEHIPQKQAVAAMGQPVLMQRYAAVLKKHGIQVAQVLVSRGDMEDRPRFLNSQHTMEEIFKFGALPIVNENDTVAVDEIRFGDNDQLSAMVAHLVDADLLVILTDIDGLHDTDPRKNPSAKRISVVDKIDKKIQATASGSLSQLSTGGMVTKLKAAEQAAQNGIPTWIVAGHDPAILKSVLAGKDVGTLFLPQPKKSKIRRS